MAGQTLGRSDRHVRRARLRIGTGAPRHRLAFNVEETLRLCALPGENEGRVYYFRHLHVGGLPEDGDRRVWLDAFQHGLLELARSAVHGTDGAARTADAIFFLNEQEACESLLALIVRRRPADAWFWPAVSGAPAGASRATVVVALIEKLLRAPASWMTAAAAVFAAIDRDRPGALLSLLPDAVVRQWLGEFGGEDAGLHDVAPIRFPASMRAAMEQASASLGADDPRVVWLASLAIILASPAELGRGAVPSRARLTLRTLGSAGPLPPLSRETEPASPRRLSAEPEDAPNILQRDRADASEPRFSSRERDHPSEPQSSSSKRERGHKPAEQEKRTRGSPDLLISPPEPKAAAETRQTNDGDRPTTSPDVGPADRTATREPPPHDTPSPRDRCFGEATNGAGLYFLLNALRHLKPDEDLLDPWFLAHFFQRAARYADIESDDPILLWTFATLDQADAGAVDDRLLRIWLLKVRRWCWRNGKIGVREIVRRPGRVTLTRTDLDVALSLDCVDIRIRRIGLDLDPGWLPWFGRVVRFHYLARGELHA
jgi:hypothetical protein